MGLLDTFHTFSFKGMSDFFISNDTANRATTLWILSRTFGSIGLLLSAYIPANLKVKTKKEIFERNAPYIIKHTDELITLNTRGFSICKLGEFITPVFDERCETLEAGDKLLMYSDGLIESRDSNKEQYG